MVDLRVRLRAVWRRTFSLSWPVAVQQTFNTLMRTTDVVVTGLFSPAAVAAVGLADLYAQLPMRIGIGFGAGAIALSSQDTGRGAVTSRDRAITQALIIGFLAGIPFVFVGLLFGQLAVAVLGASSEVARMGGTYLTIVFAIAPARIVGIVGSRALQGTGDTRTPMYVNGTSNVINILASVGLGLGVGPLPRLEIVGVALATALGRTFVAAAILLLIATNRTTVSFARPTSYTTTRQLVAVSLPGIAEGMSTAIGNFPYNAILLGFGTEVNAAYHIGRRAFQQITGPLYRSYGVAASVIVGQTLGEGKPDEARFSGLGILLLSAVTLGLTGVGLFVAAEPLARLFTQDPSTIQFSIAFVMAYGVASVFLGISYPFSGSLLGAGDTRTPFYARLTGTFGFMVGFSYLFGVVLGYGLLGVYAGLVLNFAWRALVVGVGFLRGNWADRAATMMAERSAASDSD
ncbi:MAG: MATE family efflux transporter [Halobacteriota archaeon]